MVITNDGSVSTNHWISKVDYTHMPKYELRYEDTELLCLRAKRYGIATIVVSPVELPLVRQRFDPERLLTVAVAVGYPNGVYPVAIKKKEIEEAVANGADEVYMVMSVSLFLDGRIDLIQEEIHMLKETAGTRVTKYILEAGALSDDQKKLACELAIQGGLDYVVTSTGFTPNDMPPTTVQDILLLTEFAKGRIGIVASGSIDDRRMMLEYLDAGAERICSEYADRIV